MAAQWNHRQSSTGGIAFQHPHDSDVLAHAGKVISWHRPIEVPFAINHQGLPMLLQHLLLQNGDGGGLTATVVSWSGITPKDANSRIGRQPRIYVADGCEKLRVNWFVPDAVGGLGCSLPDLLQLGPGYILALNITVKGRLLRGAAELHYDGSHFLREVGMTDHGDSQIGIQSPLVSLAQRDNVGLIEH